MMVVAIAVSLMGIGGVLSADAILASEISRNYLGTHPASATLEMGAIDADLLAQVRARPGIADATARRTIVARLQLGPDQWRRFLLFVIDPGDRLRVSGFTVEQGAWPTSTDGILLERSGLELLGAGPGSTIVIKTPSGTPQPLRVEGVVHDPSLAPAWQERTGYGYVTTAALAALGEANGLNELKITVAPDPYDAAAINRVAGNLATWLATQGHPVTEIQIPPPGQHPHSGQMNAVLTMFLAIGVLAVVLSMVLVAAIVSAMLAQQVRQIGVMKAVGARARQIVSLYLLMMLVIGVLATVLGVVLSAPLGRGLASLVGALLNFNIVNDAVPSWVVAILAMAGIGVPLLVASVPIVRGSRITVRQAIDDHGVSQGQASGGRLERGLGAIGGLDRAMLLPLRNMLRRRARLVMTVTLLASGGAMFMTGMNTAAAWNTALDVGLANRHYDLEVRLAGAYPAQRLTSLVGAVPGVTGVEAWGSAPTTVAGSRGAEVVRTYPDGGHGSFSLTAPPSGTTLVDFPLLEGRWLEPGDADAVVLNQVTRAQLTAHVGDRIELATNGRIASWRVVGIVQEVGAQSIAYVTEESFAKAVGETGQASLVRVTTADHSVAGRTAVLRDVEHALAAALVPVALSLPLTELRAALDGHVLILVGTVIFMAILMAIVGSLGLSTAMSISVLERTREFGIMRVLGATPGMVRRIVVTEGVALGALSWLLAIVLSLPLSAAVGSLVGSISFQLPLPLVVSPLGVLIWLLIAVVGSAAASAAPARGASRLTVREALAYA